MTRFAVYRCAGAIATLVACGSRTPDSLLAVLPVDDDRVLLVRSPGGSAEAYVTLEEPARKRTAWKASLPGFTAETVSRQAYAADDRIVSLRTQPAGGRPTTIAIALADGRRLWTFDGPPKPDAPAARATLADATQEIEVYGLEDPAIVALDRGRGSELWRWRPRDNRDVARRVWLRSRFVVVADPAGVELIDRANGKARRISARSQCLTGDSAYYIDDTGALRRFRFNDDQDAVVAAPSAAGMTLRDACGRRGEFDILAVDDASGAALVAVRPGAEGVAWRIELGRGGLGAHAGTVDAEIRFRFPDQHPLATGSGRYLPLLLDETPSQAVSSIRLVVVDLEQRAVVWSTRVDPAFHHAWLRGDGPRAHLVIARAAVLWDGSSPRPIRARRLDGGADLLPHQFARTRLWAADGTSLIALDATTLQPVSGLTAPRSVDVLPEFLALEDRPPPR